MKPVRKANRAALPKPGDIVPCVFCGERVPYADLALRNHKCPGGDLADTGRMAPLTPEAVAKADSAFDDFLSRPVDLDETETKDEP